MFGVTKCPKCENASFKLVIFEPVGANYKMNFIQCAHCNTPVGVAEYYDSGVLLKKQEKTLEKHSTALDDIETRLRHVEHIVVQVANFLNQRR